jgi:hypothetical protein
MTVQGDLVGVVKTFQDAANRHAVDEVMAMFTEDAEVELKGTTRLLGKSEIRSIFEYDAGVNGNIQLINCTESVDAVSCQLVETNERLRLAGLSSLLYPSCVLSFEKKLIRSWRVTPDPESIQTFNQFWGPVGLWIAKYYPSDYARMFTREGRFIRNRDNGERAVQLAREYRSTGAS